MGRLFWLHGGLLVLVRGLDELMGHARYLIGSEQRGDLGFGAKIPGFEQVLTLRCHEGTDHPPQKAHESLDITCTMSTERSRREAWRGAQQR